ncbi:hypothetical protein GA0115256_103515 [Streptomyces sp. DconLS]|nr:hypothetical protein GA0115258_10092 [Streptomyces sp. LamerLS-31b]SCF59081.1 hypothetical protein GA0115256_103515 [Streptomyces sp. DconLS]
MAILIQTSNNPVSPAAAQRLAVTRAGQLSAFVTRERRGADQRCPWELVSLTGHSDAERAAMAWIVAEAVMRQRCGPSPTAFPAWERATLAGRKLQGVEREVVLSFAEPVFKPQEKATAEEHHGVPGYVGEWLWYLLALEQPDLPDRVREYLAEPSLTVTDSGGDGLVIHRVGGAVASALMFRLWEMKKYTGGRDQISGTIKGAWDQLASSGTRYLAAQMGWAYKHVAGDVGAFVSMLPDLWANGDSRGGAGVSVATNSSATPQRRAFSRSHERIPRLKHAGQLQGLIIAVDDFAGFAAQVQETVWTAL